MKLWFAWRPVKAFSSKEKKYVWVFWEYVEPHYYNTVGLGSSYWWYKKLEKFESKSLYYADACKGNRLQKHHDSLFRKISRHIESLINGLH